MFGFAESGKRYAGLFICRSCKFMQACALCSNPEKGLRPLLYMQVLQMCVRTPRVPESAKRGRPVIYMQVLQNCAGNVTPLFPESE